MAHIPYIPDGDIPGSDRVPDSDHILRIHRVHPALTPAITAYFAFVNRIADGLGVELERP